MDYKIDRKEYQRTQETRTKETRTKEIREMEMFVVVRSVDVNGMKIFQSLRCGRRYYTYSHSAELDPASHLLRR